MKRILKRIAKRLLSTVRHTLQSIKLFFAILYVRLERRKRFPIPSTAQKILYVGHSYHAKTKSTGFLIELLQQHFPVEVLLDESWNGGSFPDLSRVDATFRAVIFFQSMPPPSALAALPCKNIILFPMYDGVIQDFFLWMPYRHCKIVNFSQSLHSKMLSWGLLSFTVKYFPDVRTFSPGNRGSAFLWQRTTRIDVNLVEVLLGSHPTQLHIHQALDPGHTYQPPTPGQRERFEITTSSWLPTREDLDLLLANRGIYFAPREVEGIGMSFLEAMASGKAVVAVNRPTMNEYIQHGVTGYLYNIDNPVAIDFSKVEQVQKNAHRAMETGYREWLGDQAALIGFLNNEQP